MQDWTDLRRNCSSPNTPEKEQNSLGIRSPCEMQTRLRVELDSLLVASRVRSMRYEAVEHHVQVTFFTPAARSSFLSSTAPCVSLLPSPAAAPSTPLVSLLRAAALPHKRSSDRSSDVASNPRTISPRCSKKSPWPISLPVSRR